VGYDSGQLFKLYPRDLLDVRYLLTFGAIFFKDPSIRYENLASVKIHCGFLDRKAIKSGGIYQKIALQILKARRTLMLDGI